VLCAARRFWRRRDRPRLPLSLHPFLTRSLRPRRPCRPDPSDPRGAAAHRRQVQPRPGPLHSMKHYLGIDIGTFESKGVLIAEDGATLAPPPKPHKMHVPQAGWAEHRPREDWWHDFTFISRKLLADSKARPADVKAIGASAIGPCMLPVDAAGEPLM